jgi:hypothetical protein
MSVKHRFHAAQELLSGLEDKLFDLEKKLLPEQSELAQEVFDLAQLCADAWKLLDAVADEYSSDEELVAEFTKGLCESCEKIYPETMYEGIEEDLRCLPELCEKVLFRAGIPLDGLMPNDLQKIPEYLRLRLREAD